MLKCPAWTLCNTWAAQHASMTEKSQVALLEMNLLDAAWDLHYARLTAWLLKTQRLRGREEIQDRQVTIMRGRSARMSLPEEVAFMRSSILLNADSPVVSPTAATRSALAGLQGREAESSIRDKQQDADLKGRECCRVTPLASWRRRQRAVRAVGILDAGSDG